MKKTKYPGLYKLPDGRYRIRATSVCQRTGKLAEAVRTLDKRTLESEALTQLAELKAELKQGTEARPGNQHRLTVADYAEQWLEAKAARVRPAVAGHYEHCLADFVLPQIGQIYIDTITRLDVERWVAWAERQNMPDGRAYSKDTVHGWWRVLTAMLKDAVAEFSLPADPTYRVRAPSLSGNNGRRERQTLSPADLGKLLDAIKQCRPDRYAEVFMLAFTGMRAGELYALQWEDIDEVHGLIHVRRSVCRGHVSATKTGSPRDVALTAEMMQVLKEHRNSQASEEHPGSRPGLVFPADNGSHRTPSSLVKPLASAVKLAEIGFRLGPHVLRRTFNTLMVHAGVDRIVLRSQMGHCSEEMTERYAGVNIQDKQAAVARLLHLTAPT